MTSNLSFLAGLLLWPLFSSAQDGIPYLDFSLTNFGNSSVWVEWSVTAGNTCQDVQVWRGTDSIHLKQVFVYPGICGDNDSVKTYTYLDHPPISGIRYYYRIQIITDKTEVKSILSLPNNQLEIYPNPAKDKIILVRDPLIQYTSYILYDDQGKKLREKHKPDVNLEWTIQELSPGTYLLRTAHESGEDIYKLLVQ